MPTATAAPVRPSRVRRPAPVKPALTYSVAPGPVPAGNPDRVVRFDLLSAMIRWGVTIDALAEGTGLSVWSVRKMRIAGECPETVRNLFLEPRYLLVTINGREYRGYANHKGTVRRWKLWYAHAAGTTTHTVSEGPYGPECTCPAARSGRCKHVSALIGLDMIDGTAVAPPAHVHDVFDVSGI